MNCTTARQQIHAALDGELDVAQQAVLDAHLRGCGACRAMRSELVTIRAAMQRLAAASEPDGSALGPIPFWPVRRMVWSAVPTWTWAVAAVVVLCLGGWLASGWLRHSPVKPGPVMVDRTQPVAPAGAVPSPHLAPQADRQVTIRTPPDTLVVPYKSRNPRVTMFWLYKVRTAAEDREPADRDAGRPM